MKVFITNTVVLNTGDAAILQGLIETLRTAFGKDTEFIVYDNQPDVASKYYPELIFRKWCYLNLAQPPFISYLGARLGGEIQRMLRPINLNRVYFAAWCWTHNLHFITKFILNKEEIQDILEYSSADLIVSTGGTYLVDNYALEPRIFDYEITLLLQRPLLFFTQSLGPFSIPKYKEPLRKIFNKSLLILLRDQKSYNNLLELGIKNENMYITADAAFALANDSVIEAAQNIESLFSSPRIAISVRAWKHFKTVAPAIGMEKYLQALQAVTVHLVEKYGAKITYISTCQGISEYWADDSKVASNIMEKLPATILDSVYLDKDFHSPDQLAEILKSFDLVISTRMHMAILALGVGVPVLPIAYEFKTKELFKSLDQGRWVIDVEEISHKLMISHTDSFIASIPEIRKTLFVAVKHERERALGSYALVKKSLKKESKH
jgi:colanic acid/amylovoran biosynthesis protein